MLTAYKRCHWFNSDFHSGFLLNDNQKISEISFDVNPFQINVNNNLKVITYVRDANQSKPIQIKLKEPYNQSREVFNDDNEGYPIVYTNHTGTEGMNNYYPYSVTRLIPQQIPRFTFRVDDNYNQFIGNSYFTSLTNGEVLQVAMGTPTEKFIIFRNSGSFTLTDKMLVDILVIGGGGGGGASWGAGGGAGALIYKTNYTLASGTYTITIGGGGAGGVNSTSGAVHAGTTGSDTSVVNSTTSTTLFLAKGGGGGGAWSSDAGKNGGSGGGSSGGSAVGTAVSTNIPQDADVFGNNGGSGGSGNWIGGGGGGAGAVGTTASASQAGNGGAGKVISITGVSISYAGGGGGGSSSAVNNTAGTGGSGGGGNGGNSTTKAGANGTANTGGGGGGAYYGSSTTESSGGSGGSGVVIIRYREMRNRIEGITPEETLIQATNTNIPITIDSQYQINYQTPMVLPKGTYETIFNNGAITFKSKPDYSYPNTSNIPIIWYKFDTNGFLLDSSGNSSNLTNNNASLDINNYKKGDGSLSVGNNKYVSFINDIQFRNIQTANGISVSVWFKGTTSGTWSPIFSFGMPYSDGNTKVFTIAKSASTTNLQFFYPRAGNSFVTSGTNYFNNTWNHIIWTITNAGVSTIYINGVNIGATLAQENFAVSNDYNNNKFLGRGVATTDEYLDGNIDDFRIYDYVLSPAEVYDLYNGNTDRSYPILKDANGVNINPLVWYHFDGSVTGMLNNSSSSINNLTNSGATFDKNNFIKGNGSIRSDASTNTDKLYITSPTLNLNTINSTNGISFSFWFRSDSTSSSFPAIFDFSGASTGITLTKYGATTDLYFINTPITGGQSVYQTSGTNFFNNNWYHIVWSISTTGVWNIYVNNSLALNNSSRNIINIDYTNTVDYVFFNRSPINSTNPLKGNIDDFRIYSSVLTATQVSELYNGRLAIYNPPGFILGTEIEPESE